MRPAEAGRIGAIPSQVTGLLVRPDCSCGFTSAAAVLGEVNVRPLVTGPQSFPGCFPYGAFYLGPRFAQPEGLAVGAVAQAKTLSAVAVCILQGKGAHADSHRFERGQGF